MPIHDGGILDRHQRQNGPTCGTNFLPLFAAIEIITCPPKSYRMAAGGEGGVVVYTRQANGVLQDTWSLFGEGDGEGTETLTPYEARATRGSAG
jgi:hypothetical protein